MITWPSTPHPHGIDNKLIKLKKKIKIQVQFPAQRPLSSEQELGFAYFWVCVFCITAFA